MTKQHLLNWLNNTVWGDMMIREILPQIGGADREAEAMKNRILTAASQPFSGSTTYYVSENGKDDFDGLSPNTPVTFGKIAEQVELHPGDAVLFERGSVFRIGEMLWLKPAVHYGAYGVGEKPLVLGSLKNYADGNLWEKTENDDVWVAEVKGEQRASLVTFNGDKFSGNWCFIKEDMKENGDFFHDHENGLFFLYFSDGNPGEMFEQIEIATTGVGFRASFIDGMSVDNITFKYFAQGAFLFGECNDITVTNCIMAWQGGKIFEIRGEIPIRYGNAAEFWYQCRNITVRDCYIYQIYDAAITFQGCGDAGPIFENIKFDNNLIEYCSMNIEYWAGNAGDKIAPHIDNISYSGNIIRFCGYGFGGIERLDKEDQALLLGWNRKYTDVNNFVIQDNILDCSNGYYIYLYGPKDQSGIRLSNNSYYQKLPSGNHECTDIIKGRDTKATNQSEFEHSILLFDEKPKKVQWIE